MENPLMTFDTAWLPFVFFIVAYLIYWFLPDTGFWKKMVGYGRLDDGRASRNDLYFQKGIGFLLLGPVSLAAAFIWGPGSEVRYGLALPTGSRALIWFLVPTVITLLLMGLRPKKGLNIEYYPQVRLTEWKPADVFWNAFFWTIYLLGYEFAFRGMMFFPLLDTLGFWPAAIAGAVVYSAVHIPKGGFEAIFALPYGLLLYYIAMDTGSFLIPCVLHLEMALMNDFRSLAHNPGMKLIRGK